MGKRNYNEPERIARRLKYHTVERISEAKMMDYSDGFIYDPAHFIDSSFIIKQFILQQYKCIYCNVKLKSRGLYQVRFGRINLDIGHTKNNVILCCLICLSLRNDDYNFSEF